MKTISIHEATIRDIRELTQSCAQAKREAKQLMMQGDLNRYFQKLLEIAQLQDELTHDLAA